MNSEIKAKWVTALRSGDYKQAKNRLKVDKPDGSFGYCCLGVLCDIAEKAGVGETIRHGGFWTYGQSLDQSWSSLPDYVQDWAGLQTHDPKVPEPGTGWATGLSTLNDVGTSFDTIAQLIEDHL